LKVALNTISLTLFSEAKIKNREWPEH